MMEHCMKINGNRFTVFSDMSNYTYSVKVYYKKDLPKAMEIAEREASLWGGGFEDEYEKGSDKYNYYHNAGYAEVVENALKEANIESVGYDEYEEMWNTISTRKWVRCDIPKETAGRLKEYCRDMQYKYETSENGMDIHFEVYLSDEEKVKANKFIDEHC